MRTSNAFSGTLRLKAEVKFTFVTQGRFPKRPWSDFQNPLAVIQIQAQTAPTT